MLVNVDDEEELLADMALVDEHGNPLKGIRMEGTVRGSSSKTHFGVALDPGGDPEETFHVSKDLVEILAGDSVAPTYFVVVAGKIVEVNGLHLPTGVHVEGYHTDRADAEQELRPSGRKTVARPNPVPATPTIATPPATAATSSNTTPIPVPPPPAPIQRTVATPPAPEPETPRTGDTVEDDSVEEDLAEPDEEDEDEQSQPSEVVSVAFIIIIRAVFIMLACL